MKGLKKSENGFSENRINRKLAFYMFEILICMVCIGIMTWVWFSGNAERSVQKTKESQYDVMVTVTNSEDGIEIPPSGERSYFLDPGTYNVIIKAMGTSSNGYCMITLPNSNDKSYTPQLPSQNEFNFAIQLTGGGEVKFTPMWGEYSDDVSNVIGEETTLVA